MISIEAWRARIGSFNNKRYSGLLSSLFSSSSYYYYHPRKRKNLSREFSTPTTVNAGLTSIHASSSSSMDSPSAEKTSPNTCIPAEKASSEPSTTTSIPSSSAGILPSSSSSSSFFTTITFSSFFLFSSLFSMRHSLLREVLVILLIAIISQQLIISGDIETNPGPKRTADDKPDLSDLQYMSYTGDDGRDVHFRLMDQLKPHWKRLAIALKFPQHEIGIMESKDDPVYYLLTEWLRGANKEKDSRPASWRTLVEALRHANVQEEASVLEEKLILGLKAASHSNNPPRESQDIDKEYLCRNKPTSGSEPPAGSSPESVVNEVPDQPGEPEIKGMTHNSLQLKWSKPKHSSDIVQSYTLSYCCVGDPPYQWSTQTCSEEYAMLTKLIPGSVYRFKVFANSCTGPGLASEVSEVKLPPDQPGKPVASEATYNSVCLKWTKPKHGAETVQSYIISYQAVDNQCYNISTTSKHEYVTVTKLTPKTVYTFKVRAVSVAGHGPDSELSNPVETALPPPGKPHASNVTHNSLQLNWEKPSHGAGSVQFYTVSYYCTGSMYEWNTERTPVAVESIQFDSILPNTVYYFKVRAESATGPSPDSEYSEPIVTVSPICQPGKPVATKVTHDSITLKWEKPERGAENVNHYILDYCALDQQDRWLTYKRHGPQASVCLTGLQPKTIYIFKVRAECSVASSLDSKFSGPIETSQLPPSGMSYGQNIFGLEKPCLGQPFQLGMVYDCRSDALISGVTLWGSDALNATVSKKPFETSDFEVITEDSLSEKLLHLGVDAHLNLSILSGLVQVEGAAKFLYNQKSSRKQARVSLKYKSTTRFEQLKMDQLGNFEYTDVFEKDIATHVVIGIVYGADAFFVFDQEMEENEDMKKIHENLKIKVGGLPGLEKLAIGRKDSNTGDKEDEEQLHCKFYGDIFLPKHPATFHDAAKVYQELPELLQGKSVPKKVWLYPLGKLDSKAHRMVYQISSRLVDELHILMESLHDIIMRGNDLIKTEVCSNFFGLKDDLENMKGLISGYKADLEKNLATLLPKVRGGRADETEVAEILEKNSLSPFSYQSLSGWISEKETEVKILAGYLKLLKQQEVIQLAFEPGEVSVIINNIEAVVCFDFGITWGQDALLLKMGDYLCNGEVCQGGSIPQPWYRRSVFLQAMRKQLFCFIHFATANHRREATRYIVTNSDSNNGTETALNFVSLYESARFETPDRPGKPWSSNISHTGLQLNWEKPRYGASSIQSYTVSYTDDQSSGQWCSTQATSGAEQQLVLSELIPGTVYFFKVRAETKAGCSPDSDVCMIRLPPAM